MEKEKRLDEERKNRALNDYLASLTDAQREEYFRSQRRREEDERARREEEERVRNEEKLRAYNEAKRLAAEEARKREENEMRLNFMKSLHMESFELENKHNLTRSYVFSYFDMIKYMNSSSNNKPNKKKSNSYPAQAKKYR